LIILDTVPRRPLSLELSDTKVFELMTIRIDPCFEDE